jgi:hypothetical protein
MSRRAVGAAGRASVLTGTARAGARRSDQIPVNVLADVPAQIRPGVLFETEMDWPEHTRIVDIPGDFFQLCMSQRGPRDIRIGQGQGPAPRTVEALQEPRAAPPSVA